MNRQYAPPFRPAVLDAADTSNFDSEFTSEAPTDSISNDSKLSDAVQQQFQGFTFQQTEAIAGSIAAGSVMATNPVNPVV
jgi:serum/glucocorticoid-regulated kinase 2